MQKRPQRRIDNHHQATSAPAPLRKRHHPAAHNDGKHLPFPPCEKANSTDPWRTQTDEVVGHHQSPTRTMDRRQVEAGCSPISSCPRLPRLTSKGKLVAAVACANPAVLVIARSPKLPSTAHGQARRLAEEEGRGEGPDTRARCEFTFGPAKSAERKLIFQRFR